jgi:hypothetical protein
MTASIGVVVAATVGGPGLRAVRRTTSSLRLFQAAHAGQRPCHFGASAPHSEQM